MAFVQNREGLTFPEAVRRLAALAQVELPASGPGPAEAQLGAAVAAAESFFRACLASAEGQAAREYLRSRGATEELGRAFGLGWAPVAWTRLTVHLAQQRLLPAGRQVGLSVPRPSGAGSFDLFRGRITFPLATAEGRTVGFGGRLLSGGSPKYLNSPDSPLFRRARLLFGLPQARAAIHSHGAAVLVEGYFDCLALHHVGLPYAVALCGATVLPAHLEQLARAGARELLLLLDGDSAGAAAVLSSAPALLLGGLPTRVALLPQGDDPDSFVLRHGRAALEHLLAAALPLSEHLLAAALPGGARSGFEAKLVGLAALRPQFARLPRGLPYAAFLADAARHFGLDMATLGDELPPAPGPDV